MIRIRIGSQKSAENCGDIREKIITSESFISIQILIDER